MKSVLEVIQATIPYFRKCGIENPRLNIEHLLAHVLRKKRMDLYLEFDRPVADQDLETLRELVKRRAQGEPLQHLLGTVEFLGRFFACDKRALIPRPETERLCELLLEEFGSRIGSGRVLDVGTGSGVIALTLAAEWPEAQIEAIDISSDALALARENAARLRLETRVKFSEANLLENMTGELRLIVANVPYVDPAEQSSLARELQHEPPLALYAGAGGLELLRQLIAQATRHLRGSLALEIGYDQAQAICELLREHNYQDIRVLCDYQERQRFVFATYG